MTQIVNRANDIKQTNDNVMIITFVLLLGMRKDKNGANKNKKMSKKYNIAPNR